MTTFHYDFERPHLLWATLSLVGPRRQRQRAFFIFFFLKMIESSFNSEERNERNENFLNLLPI